MKKILSGLILVLIAISSSPVSAISTSNTPPVEQELGQNVVRKNSELYSRGEQQANAYIELKSDDTAWVNKNPKLENYGVLYYMDSYPVYVEYPIVCGNDDCGYVTISILGDHSSFVEGSVVGSSPSQFLTTSYKSKHNKQAKDARFYRGGVFDKYLIGDDDGVSFDARYDDLNKDEKKKRVKDALDIISTGSTIYVGSTIVINDTTGTNVYVNGASAANCPSRIPCYSQQTTTYPTGTCLSGCGPVALGMLMGYYDRNGKSNLLPSVTAPTFQNATAHTMITDIGKLIGTVCNANSGDSNTTMVLNGVQYAKNKGYLESTSTKYIRANYTDLSFKSILQTEINASRPVIGQSQNHFFVIYGYSNSAPSLIVRVNFGWALTTTAASNVDVSMNDLFRYNGGTETLQYMLTYNIR